MTETDRLAEIREQDRTERIDEIRARVNSARMSPDASDLLDLAEELVFTDIPYLLGLVDELQRERDALTKRLTRHEAYAEMAETDE